MILLGLRALQQWQRSKAKAVRMATVAAATKSTPSAPAPAASSRLLPSCNKNKNKKIVVPGPLFTRVQTGLGRLVAQASGDVSQKTTRLVNISHQAPFRWIPLRSSKVAKAGAAVVYGSNYGGGLLPGDAYETNVHVAPHARLGLLTQGSNRVYKQLRQTNEDMNDTAQTDRPSCVSARYNVDANGLLVVAPDPMTPFEDSILKQQQSITLHPDANLCFIDWVAAGRLAQGERWQQASLTSRTELKFIDMAKPSLVDAVQLRNRQDTGMDWSTTQFNAYATLVLYGEQVQTVKENCLALQTILASQVTSTRATLDESTHPLSADDALERLPSRMAGPVVMGVTPNAGQQDIMVVRLAATANDDLYRIFHSCLAPLTEGFGHHFYQERIRAVHSGTVPLAATTKFVDGREATDNTRMSPGNGSTPTITSPAAHWVAHVLTDSSLPTGGFAHSAGLEAAAQLKIVQNTEDIEAFVHATVQSTLQLITPTLASIYDAVHCDQLDSRWNNIHEELQALLVANGPACRASLDQGTSLLRLAKKWPDLSLDRTLGTAITQAHYAPVFGAVTATAGLSINETRQLLAYTTARDVVSAAVRLNLLGPLASVPLLARAHEAIVHNCENAMAASCAPLLEALQPLHDVLAVRLFRT